MIKRKIIVINKVLQLRYAGVIIASMLFAVALIFISTFHYVNLNRDLFASMPGGVGVVYGMAKFLAAIMIVYSVLVIVFSLFASHKFAGPIYRFQQVIRTITEGDISGKVVLREKDELMEIKDDLNNMLTALRNNVKKDRENAKMADLMISEIKAIVQQPLTQQKVQEIVDIINKLEPKIKEISVHFKI